MFKKLLQIIETANFKGALKRGELACPDCGKKNTKLATTAQDILVCAQCGTQASALEWAATGTKLRHAANPDKPPAGTKITRQIEPHGNVVWNIPASGKSGGFLFFAIFWCGITGFLTLAALFGENSFRPSSDFPLQLLIIPFFLIFWGVGLTLLYIACSNRFGKNRITVSKESITLSRELFGRSTHRSLALDSIQSISQVEFYQSNYQPVYGIEIRGKTGKLRFGSILSNDEKSWLVADLKRIVSGPDASTTTPVNSQSPGTRQSSFSFPLPKSNNNLCGLGIMLLVMGCGFVWIGIYLLHPETGTSDQKSLGAFRAIEFLFDLINNSFRTIWILMSCGMAAIGLTIILWLNRTKNRETLIEGSDSEIAIRTTQHGRVLKERVFPRANVSGIRSSTSGTSNGKAMKRLEIHVAGKAETVSHWIDGEKADELAEKVRNALF